MPIAEWDRRAAIAACGVIAFVTAMVNGAARAQSGLPVGNIRVDVAPLRANVGDRSCRANSLRRSPVA
jgi:hypothetical protein